MAVTEIFKGFYRINLPIPRGGFESFLDGWLIDDREKERTILVETGPASAVPELLRRLEELKVNEIDYLILTHIHLDHAGGAGQFIEAFPDTKVLAPEKGRRHLIDP
ncbi:MAG: MBL fold metallo-hydrolase, partial [Synergistes sp.]|nr:MBL fold metallo-hydrolase [Synergistes sp.]